MLLRLVIRVFGRIFHRKCSLTKRPRNPSTFQECVDLPQQPRGYWKPVLCIVLLLPTIYYMFYYRGYSNSLAFNGDLFTNAQQTFNPDDDIIVPKKSNVSKIPEKPIKEQRTIRTRKPYVDLDGLPLCTVITVATPENFNDTLHNVTYISTKTYDTKIAQRLGVRMGGHFVPESCRPRYKVAILVPYWWNRKQNLKIFLYYIHPFLIRQRLEYRIFVVEQHAVDVYKLMKMIGPAQNIPLGDEPFNKGRLFNAGFLEIQKNDDWQCVIFHDVDLLPADDRIRYSCPVLPRHMCAAVLGMENVVKYNTVFGGVTAMTMWHYKKANGYSNLYWGRGESEDMFKRLQAAGLGVTRYKKDVARYISLKHTYRPDNPNRIELLVTAEDRYKDDGLSTLRYNVASYSSLPLYTHIVVNVNNFKNPPDYITEASVTLSP